MDNIHHHRINRTKKTSKKPERIQLTQKVATIHGVRGSSRKQLWL